MVLVASYGLAAVLVLMTFESCGVPFPSEVIMPVGGLLAATGHLNLEAVIVAGALGNVFGSLAAYALAARFGTVVLLGPGRWIGISPRHVASADGWFQRYGLVAVLVGRVLPVVRTYISFPAGLARVPVLPFTALTFIGALPWAALLTLIGFWLGENYTRITGSIEKAAVVIAVLVVALVVVWFFRVRREASAA
jgi:membrane protein DedA with SNARE-associated domain